jgi:hypothetical protein
MQKLIHDTVTEIVWRKELRTPSVLSRPLVNSLAVEEQLHEPPHETRYEQAPRHETALVNNEPLLEFENSKQKRDVQVQRTPSAVRSVTEHIDELKTSAYETVYDSREDPAKYQSIVRDETLDFINQKVGITRTRGLIMATPGQAQAEFINAAVVTCADDLSTLYENVKTVPVDDKIEYPASKNYYSASKLNLIHRPYVCKLDTSLLEELCVDIEDDNLLLKQLQSSQSQIIENPIQGEKSQVRVNKIETRACVLHDNQNHQETCEALQLAKPPQAHTLATALNDPDLFQFDSDVQQSRARVFNLPTSVPSDITLLSSEPLNQPKLNETNLVCQIEPDLLLKYDREIQQCQARVLSNSSSVPCDTFLLSTESLDQPKLIKSNLMCTVEPLPALAPRPDRVETLKAIAMGVRSKLACNESIDLTVNELAVTQPIECLTQKAVTLAEQSDLLAPASLNMRYQPQVLSRERHAFDEMLKEQAEIKQTDEVKTQKLTIANERNDLEQESPPVAKRPVIISKEILSNIEGLFNERAKELAVEDRPAEEMAAQQNVPTPLVPSSLIDAKLLLWLHCPEISVSTSENDLEEQTINIDDKLDLLYETITVRPHQSQLSDVDMVHVDKVLSLLLPGSGQVEFSDENANHMQTQKLELLHEHLRSFREPNRFDLDCICTADLTTEPLVLMSEPAVMSPDSVEIPIEREELKKKQRALNSSVETNQVDVYEEVVSLNHTAHQSRLLDSSQENIDIEIDCDMVVLNHPVDTTVEIYADVEMMMMSPGNNCRMMTRDIDLNGCVESLSSRATSCTGSSTAVSQSRRHVNKRDLYDLNEVFAQHFFEQIVLTSPSGDDDGGGSGSEIMREVTTSGFFRESYATQNDRLVDNEDEVEWHEVTSTHQVEEGQYYADLIETTVTTTNTPAPGHYSGQEEEYEQRNGYIQLDSTYEINDVNNQLAPVQFEIHFRSDSGGPINGNDSREERFSFTAPGNVYILN